MLVILMDTYPIIAKIVQVIYFIIVSCMIIIIILGIFFIILKKDELKKPKLPRDQSRPFTKLLKGNLVPIGGGVAGGVALFIFFIIFVATISFIASWSPFQGHVTIDMESVYYKNDTQIPVLIQVTGPNTGVFAIVYKDLSGTLSNIAYIGPIDPIFFDLESDIDERNIESNNILVGNYLGNGKYSVFINTINLTAGYYELTCLRKGYYEKTCESKSFYILNNS